MTRQYGSRRALAAGAAFCALIAGWAGSAMAQDAPVETAAAVDTATPPPLDAREARIKALEDAVAALSDQIADLKAQEASNSKDLRDTWSAAPKATITAGKPTIASADGKFSATLHAVMQYDFAQYMQDNPLPAAITDHTRDLNSGSNFRRARLGIDGKAFGDFDYYFLYEFGGSGTEDAARIQEIWLQYSGFKPFHLRIGAFQPAVGLEDQASTNGSPFLERPSPSEIARSLAAGDFRTAAELWASGDHWFAAGAVTGNLVNTLNTAASGFTAQTYDEQVAFTGRLAATPLYGQDWRVHVGVNGSYVARPADVSGPAGTILSRYVTQFRDRPELRVDTTRLIDTGAIDAKHAYTVGLELAAQKANFFAQAEYFREGIDRRSTAVGITDPTFSGWYVEGSWIVTGEARKYNTATATFDAPPVSKPFDLKGGGWGAWEIAARYSDTDLNYHEGKAGTAIVAGGDAIRGGEQQVYAAGLNWYVNSVVRFMLQYQHIDVDRLNSSGVAIGQSLNTIALRSQLAF